MSSRLASFLPEHLVADLAAGRAPERLPAVVRRTGALLLSDVSGFTALTERLQSRGREGAEELAAVVGAVVGRVVRAVAAQGGSVVGFGGDAVMALFSGPSPVRRAVAAAEVIREGAARGSRVATSMGPVPVTLGQAVHQGDVMEIHVGTPERRHVLMAGPGVRALVGLQGSAPPGIVRLSDAARASLRREPPARPRRPARRRRAGRDALARYLRPELVKRLGRFEGGYREAAVVFLETRGARPERLQRFAEILEDRCAAVDGLLLKTDPSRDGTRWLCVLGIPSAHEEDVPRAARLALETLAGCPPGLPARAGIAAGTVVNVEIGTPARRCFDVMGDVVNTAARAAAAAAWGQVVATDGVRRGLGAVAAVDRGAVALKGKASPVRLHVLLHASPAARGVRVAAPLAGRDAEMAALETALAAVPSGMGTALAITGEAGIGKSRLKWEIAQQAAAAGIPVHEGRAEPFGGKPYGAMAELLASALGVGFGPPDARRADVVRREARRLGLSAADERHLAAVLGFPSLARSSLSPSTVRGNNLMAVASAVAALSATGPRVLVLEDLQWADDLTREAVADLASRVPSLRILLLLLGRPGFEPPASAEVLALAPLSGGAVDAMMEALISGVPAPVRHALVERVEGNPLFAEEMVRHLHESGLLVEGAGGHHLVREPGASDLPESLQALIGSRLDRLPEHARWLTDWGAVLGRSFPRAVVEMLPGGRTGVLRALPLLERHEVMFARRRDGAEELIWKHGLTRDVAYGRLLVAQRTRLHGDVAAALARLPAAARRASAASRGHHWEQAGQASRAREAYREALGEALRSYALPEAARCAERFLSLSPAPSRRGVDIRIRNAQEALRFMGRYGDAERHLAEARAEARALGDGVLEGRALAGLGHVLHETGRPDAALELYGKAHALAVRHGNRGDAVASLDHQAVIHMEQGRSSEALPLFQKALAAHRRSRHAGSEARTLCNLAVLHQGSGRFEDAGALYQRALRLARRAGDRRVEGILLLNLGEIHHELHRLDEARACYEESHAVMKEVGDRRFQGIVLGAQGTLEEALGNAGPACVLFQEGIARLREVGDRRWVAILLGVMGPSLASTGRVAEAERALRESVEVARLVQDRRTEGAALRSLAELARRRGELSTAGALVAEAEARSTEAGDLVEVGKCACERVLQAVASGADPAALLAAAQAAAARSGAAPETVLGRLVADAARAVAAARAGEPLFAGERADAIPPLLRAALAGAGAPLETAGG